MASLPPFFDLSPDMGAEPLDLTGMSPSQPAPPEDTRKKWIKLALIAPLLARAGPGALEGFMAGLNQSRQRDELFQRQNLQDAQRQQQVQSAEQYRQQTLAGQQQTRQQALLKQYQDALNNATTPDEVQALRQAYVGQAQGIGMRPGSFDTLALAQTPDRMQARRIKSVWDKLPNESKQEAMKNGWSLNVDGQPVPYEQWSQAVGGVVDPATGKAPVAAPAQVFEANTPEKLHLAAFAKARGKTPEQLTDVELEQARKKFMQSDDRPVTPPDPNLAELRRLNVEMARQRIAEAQKRFNAVNLSPGQRTELSDAKTLNDLASNVLVAGEESGWSGVGGMYRGSIAGWMAANFGTGTPEEAALRANISNIQATIAKLRGGTSFTPNEQALLEKYTPTIDDSPMVIKSKMEQLQQFLIAKAESMVQVASTPPEQVVTEMREAVGGRAAGAGPVTTTKANPFRGSNAGTGR